MPPSPERWTHIVRSLMKYRSYSSAEALDEKYRARGFRRMTIRRIISLDTEMQPGSPGWDMKLSQLSGMLDLPLETLRLVYHGEIRELERLPFDVENGAEIKRFILEQLTTQPNPGVANTRRRALG